jgi:hypothetical protein
VDRARVAARESDDAPTASRGWTAAVALSCAALLGACTLIATYPSPVDEAASPDLCTNRRDDDFDGLVDAAEARCAPFWPVPVALPSPPDWTCPEGWHVLPVQAVDAAAVAAIDIDVSTCEPGPDLGTDPSACALLSPGADAAWVAAGATLGDGSPTRPFGTIDEALRAGARVLWLQAGDHVAPATIHMEPGETLTARAQCDATLGASGAMFAVEGGGALALAGVSLTSGLDVGERTDLDIRDAAIATPDAFVLRLALSANATFLRIHDATVAGVRVEVGPTATLRLTDVALGPAQIDVIDGRVVIQRAAMGASSGSVVDVAGAFASLLASDWRVSRPPDVALGAPLVRASSGAAVTLDRVYLGGSGGSLRVEGTDSHVDASDIIVDVADAGALLAPEQVAIDVAGGSTASFVRAAILSPLGDGITAHGTQSSVTLDDVIVYRDSRVAYPEPDAVSCDPSIADACERGWECDNGHCVAPWSISAIRATGGACLTLSRAYLEGVDGAAVSVAPGCAHQLDELTVSRVRARACSRGLRSFHGRGVEVLEETQFTLTRFTIDATNGCGLSVPFHLLSSLTGALTRNGTALCGDSGFIPPPPPRGIVFRDNSADYGNSFTNCFGEISVGCGTLLADCP